MAEAVRPSAIRQSLHLLAVSGLALAQPMLNRIENNAAFVRLERLQPIAVLIAVVLILLLPAFVCAAVTQAVRWTKGVSAAWRFHQFCILSFFLLWIMLLCMWLSRTFHLMKRGIPESSYVLMSLAVSAVLTRAYSRQAWMRQLLELTACGVLIFPVSLFFNASIRAVLWPEASVVGRIGLTASTPVPVVMIVLDGVCGMSLLDESHQIDRVRYPSFARLADISNWYRNASTVHYRTDHAVPAILTGNMPSDRAAAPLESEYPLNLFRILYETDQFEMTVFEPLTRLCPVELQARQEPRSVWTQATELIATVSTVYAKSTWPAELGELNLQIPHTWFGIASATNVEEQERLRQGLIVHPWSDFRELQFDHFINCLYPRPKPAFQFLHVVAPHDPWGHLPTDSIYLHHPSFADFPQGALGNIGEIWSQDALDAQRGWQRHLLQLGWVDLQLGRILDQLEDSNMLEECLLMVVADHGMAFVPGENRREPSNTTLADILSVPLFIKYPGQTTGVIDDTNVEIIDLLPTLLDVVGIEWNEGLDGQSLVSESRYERPRKTLIGKDTEIITSADFPERFQVVRRMVELFGSGTQDNRLERLNTRPELIGRLVSEFTVLPRTQLTTYLKSGGGDIAAMPERLVPCYFEGQLLGPENPETPVEIAIAINGMLQAATRTSTDPRLRESWSAMLPEAVYTQTENDVAIFQIHSEENEIRLSPISVTPY